MHLFLYYRHYFLPYVFHRQAEHEHRNNHRNAIRQEPAAIDIVQRTYHPVPQQRTQIYVVVYQVHSHDVRTTAYRKARNTVRHVPPATCKDKEAAYRTKQWYTIVCQRPDIQQRISIAKRSQLTHITVKRKEQTYRKIAHEIDYMVEAERRQRKLLQIAAQREEREAEHQGHTTAEDASIPPTAFSKVEQQQNQQQP